MRKRSEEGETGRKSRWRDAESGEEEGKVKQGRSVKVGMKRRKGEREEEEGGG